MSDILRVHANSPETVEETWTEFAPSARLHKVDPLRTRFDWVSVATPTFSTMRYALRAGVRSSLEPEGQLFACEVRTAEGRVWTTNEELDRSKPWLSIGDPVDAAWNDAADVRAMIFDWNAALETARQITGDESLCLAVHETSAPTEQQSEHWRRTFAYVMGAFTAAPAALGEDENADGPMDGILESVLTRHALVTTLTTFNTSFLEQLGHDGEQRRAAPVTVRRAIAFMESRAREPITVDDVARHVNVTTRGLQYAFRRALECTPAQYLRRVRLDGAHHELVAASEAGGAERFGAIARRWGFTNTARFAAYYRAEYGRHPDETLRQP